MAEPGTDDGGGDECQQQGVQQFFRNAFATEKPAEQIPAEDEPGKEHQAVPADAEFPEVQQHGIYVPMDEQIGNHGGKDMN